MKHIPFLIKLNTTYTLSMMVLLTSLILISSQLLDWEYELGLEVNLMSFIPLLMWSESHSKSASSMKYFLGTAFLLIAIFLIIYPNQELKLLQELCVVTSLLTKLGSSPFHFCLPSIIENTSWLNCFLIMTSQKLGPIIAINNLMATKLMSPIISLNLVVGVWGSLNQISPGKLMAYSLITHTGWLLTAVVESSSKQWSNCWILYFVSYTILSLTLILIFFLMNTYFISQLTSNSMKPSHKWWMITCFFSMSGLPPFIGFFPKWLILENILTLKYYFTMMMLITASLISLFFLFTDLICLSIYSYLLQENKYMKNKVTNNLVMIAWLQAILLIMFPIIM